jgi:hypothetical protein
MNTVGFDSCRTCGRKLQATFFCQDCGQPYCSLECYCHHQAQHAVMPAARSLTGRTVPQQLGMSQKLMQRF